MAAPMRTIACSCTSRIFRQITLCRQIYLPRQVHTIVKRWYSESETVTGTSPSGVTSVQDDPGPTFLLSDVQDILYKITGFQLDEIFKERPIKDLNPPKYRLLTEEQLAEAQEEAILKGQDRLQMPPVMKVREDCVEAISDDPEIAGNDQHNIVFTDITYGVPKTKRTVVVRETNGLLRNATHQERDRVMQIYFPESGRMYSMPAMFSPENLEVVLGEEKYEYILDRACVQFEPDDPEYLRVTQRTYEQIASRGHFNHLRNTRHFGVMAFYFARHKKLEGLLVDMIQRNLLDDAANLIRLYNIMYPESKSARICLSENISSHEDLVKVFVKNESPHGGIVELALQTYAEEKEKSASSHEKLFQS